MKFGPLPLADAEGAILAHSLVGASGPIRKGVRLTAEHLRALAAAGMTEVAVARLEVGDVHEDEAARRIAAALASPSIGAEPAATGRSNLHAAATGLLLIDRDAVDAMNRVDAAITIATLAPYSVVSDGRMVATVKIIPYAVREESVRRVESLARAGRSLDIASFRPLRVGLVATKLPSLKPATMDKTRRVLDERLAKAGSAVMSEIRLPHDAAAIGEALRRQKADGADLLIVFGASAVVDAGDVVPEGIVAAGGRVAHVGMPVDPGNLLVLGDLDGVPVVGAPGCARSPRENGFDWVLNRLLAGLAVGSGDISGFGVGGLMMDIASRPHPRHAGGPKVAAVVLAAGEARRMGGPNKLLATIAGRPLVRIAAEAALASRAAMVVVVTGHRAADVATALDDLEVIQVHNPAYATGLASSLRTGIEALPPDIDATAILLADMPGVTAATVDRLIDAYHTEARPIVVPTFDGRQGNPVLWDRRFFAELAAIAGDTGARGLIAAHADVVARIEMGAEVATDLDTVEALQAAGAALPA